MRLDLTALAAMSLWALLAQFAHADGPGPLRNVTFRPVVEIDEVAPASFDLKKLTALALERNPILAQAAFRIDAARGRAIQAGLYPNPVLSVTGDELGDRTGAPGTWTAPQINQELVTGGKRRLANAAACKEVDQVAFALASRKFALLGEVRQAYFDALTLQTRVSILDELVDLSEKSIKQTERLLDAKVVSRLDLVQLEVEREKLRTDRETTLREKEPAFRRLAAVVGTPELAIGWLEGSLDVFPPYYDLKVAHFAILNHPDIQAAQMGADRARILVDRARVQPIPNLTLSTGYVRQSQNRSNDWMLGVSLPIPVFDRNQGNIRAALGDLGEAAKEIDRVENALQERLAAAFREYASAKYRAERYRDSVLPRALEAYDLSAKAYQGGQFEYLRVVESQRTAAQARLELVRSLGDAWKAASAISALMLDEDWPHNWSLPPQSEVPPKGR